VLEFKTKFLAYVDSSAADLRSLLAEKKELSADMKQAQASVVGLQVQGLEA